MINAADLLVAQVAPAVQTSASTSGPDIGAGEQAIVYRVPAEARTFRLIIESRLHLVPPPAVSR